MSLQKVQDYFKDTQMQEKIIVLEQSSATVELAAQALGCEPDRIAKTMSFLVEDEPILIVIAGLGRVDNKKFKQQFHAKAKMIPFDEVEQWIGHAPGGVCPFAVKENVKVYLDESLKQYEIVYPAAGSGNSAIEITIQQLETYSNYVSWVDVCREKQPEGE